MTTNYDPIAEQYQRAKQQPWRAHIEAFTLLRLVGDPTRKAVIDCQSASNILPRSACKRDPFGGGAVGGARVAK